MEESCLSVTPTDNQVNMQQFIQSVLSQVKCSTDYRDEKGVHKQICDILDSQKVYYLYEQQMLIPQPHALLKRHHAQILHNNQWWVSVEPDFMFDDFTVLEIKVDSPYEPLSVDSKRQLIEYTYIPCVANVFLALFSHKNGACIKFEKVNPVQSRMMFNNSGRVTLGV